MEFFVSADDVNNGKPSPEIYNLAVSRLGLMPQECLIIEDNPNGIKAAKASGAHLMEVIEVEDVSYWNIKIRIQDIEASK